MPAPIRPAPLPKALARSLAGLLLALAGAAAVGADRVTDAAEIHLGAQGQALPFSYQLATDRFTGYSVELCERVVAALEARRGKPYTNPPAQRWFNVTPQTRLMRLLAGDIDLECSSTSQTPARTQLGLAFSLPIFVSDLGVLLYRPDGSVPASAEQWLAQMPPRRVVVVTTDGATSVRHLEALNRGPNGPRFEVIHGRDHGDAFHKLRHREAEAFVMDRSLLAARLATDPLLQDARLVLPDWSPLPDVLEVYGLVMRETDTDLQNAVKAALCAMARPGANGEPSELLRLHQRWFGQPLPLPGGGSGRALGLAPHPEWLQRLAPARSGCPP